MNMREGNMDRARPFELREKSRYEASVRLSVAPMMDWIVVF